MCTAYDCVGRNLNNINNTRVKIDSIRKMYFTNTKTIPMI